MNSLLKAYIIGLVVTGGLFGLLAADWPGAVSATIGGVAGVLAVIVGLIGAAGVTMPSSPDSDNDNNN